MSLKKDNYKLSDKKIMNFAINLAENNKYLTGTNPSVGCVIVKNNKILSYANTNHGGRPHAESIALNKNRYNKGTSLYTTLEPCPMCMGAILLARVKTLVWGAPDIRLGAGGSWVNLLEVKHPYHTLNVRSGMYEKEVGSLMRAFFKEKRSSS